MLPQPHKSHLKVCLVARVVPFFSFTQKMITCCTVKHNQLCSKILQIHTALSHQAGSIITPITAEFSVRSAIGWHAVLQLRVYFIMQWTKQWLWTDYMRKTPFIYPHSPQTFPRSITRIITQTFHLRKISSCVIFVSGKCHRRVLTKARKAQIWPVLLTAALYRSCTRLFRASPVSHTTMALHIKTVGISGS